MPDQAKAMKDADGHWIYPGDTVVVLKSVGEVTKGEVAVFKRPYDSGRLSGFFWFDSARHAIYMTSPFVKLGVTEEEVQAAIQSIQEAL